MFRRALIAAAPLLLLASTAAAAPAGGGPATVGQYVELQPVGLPIVAKGHLVNYVFVYIRLNLSAGADATALRDKEPYFRDALVRMAHRTPFTDPADFNRIDEGKLTAALMREASVIAGPGAIRTVVVTSQAPQHRIAVPRS
ncbi:MAG: hypothetical protein E7812_05905 [Phenylobacterium sp.]|nr:MAG: hypothetical protein E7812_05905 [Phenylobacterium sp.]